MVGSRLGAALVGLAAATQAAAAVPLTPAGNGHLVVPAFVNGKGTLPFILDTGADVTGIYEWFARQQGMKPVGSQEIEGMTGKATTGTYAIARIALDGRELRDLQAESYPDRTDAEIEAGVIGNDLMAGTITVFDFPCATVAVHPKPVDLAALTAGARPIQARTVTGGTQLAFPIRVNGVAGTAILDTGARDTRVNTRFAAALKLDVTSGSFRDADLVYGANGKAMGARKGPIGAVSFADISIPRAEARIMDLPVLDTMGVGGGPAMIMGIDLMASHRLVYDFDGKRFWFARSTCSK